METVFQQSEIKTHENKKGKTIQAEKHSNHVRKLVWCMKPIIIFQLVITAQLR